MAVFLLDTNVLIAWVWPNHPHHSRAHAWLEAIGTDQWATCPMTECAFVRISSNPVFNSETLTPPEAIQILKKTVAHPSHVFWEDSVQLCESPHLPYQRLIGHKQVMDAYLLALTIERGGKLVTLDGGFLSLARNETERASLVVLT